ncbi:MAG: nodulation protein [Xanthomonadales bacterium]|nr:nodulation protein [Xanthomonadales bacterium]
MYILGINGLNAVTSVDALPGWADHDAAAVLLRDGCLVAAIEEERLNRIKHSNHFPCLAIAECLRIGGIGSEEIDVVAVNVDGGPQSFSTDSQLKELISVLFQKYVGDVSRAQVVSVNHQLAHMFSAYVSSEFDECLCLSLDGIGDGVSGAVGLARRGEIEVLRVIEKASSIGELYCELIGNIGYGRFDEYKVMALAALGSPEPYREMFSSMSRLNTEGRYELLPKHERRELVRVGWPFNRRRPGEQFSQAHFDFAAGLQELISKLVIHLLRHFRDFDQSKRLAYAGGVAHNCAVNGVILRSGLFESVFVHPASHDAGGAVGAAFAAELQISRISGVAPKSTKGRNARNMYAGRPLPNLDRQLEQLEKWCAFIHAEVRADACTHAAEQIASGHVVGWVQGRSEFGPRALGNRSIVADPRSGAIRDRINLEIKRRESYRPFAPAVLEDAVWAHFERPSSEGSLEHMTFVLRVKAESRGKFPAVVHADGTARVQVVRAAENLRFYELISAFRRITGAPMLLNTSFNGAGEPIVDSMDDAIVCLLLNKLDALVIDTVVIRAKAHCLTSETALDLRPRLASSRKIVWRSIPGSASAERGFYVETTFSQHFGGGATPVSQEVADVLIRADGLLTIKELVGSCRGWIDPLSVLNEILELWRHAHVRMNCV